jgi:hypothetical protein
VVFSREKISYHQFMVNLPPRKPILFDCPATYQIYVQGWIDPTLSSRLEGMIIGWSTQDIDPQVTILQGELGDQAALAGVLHTLYELHLTVLSVNRLKI